MANPLHVERIQASQWVALAMLALVYTVHTVDRTVVSAAVEPIKHELQLSLA